MSRFCDSIRVQTQSKRGVFTGGQIVAQGPPEAVPKCPASHTGQYLARTLARR